MTWEAGALNKGNAACMQLKGASPIASPLTRRKSSSAAKSSGTIVKLEVSGKAAAPWTDSGATAGLTMDSCMRRDLRGQRVLLTGASSGIGRALAGQLAESGARVVLAARSLDKLQEVEQFCTARGQDVATIATDVTSDTDRRRAIEFTVQRFGGLDVLVNNAGVGSFGHFADCTEDVLRRVMEVNFFAPAELIRLAIPHLAKGKQPAIVNVASMCGRRGLPAWSEYSASKFALTGLSEAIRAELARLKIEVLLIQPGLTRSDLGSHLLCNSGRMKIQFDRGMPPEKVAVSIVTALVRGRPETVLGSEAKWMLRFNRWVPRILDRLIARKVRQLYAEER
jgi:short-subunit dehydrogenase